MPLTNQFKANAMHSALLTETQTLKNKGNLRAAAAIDYYLKEADEASLARLYSILMPEPRPLGKVIEIKAGRMG